MPFDIALLLPSEDSVRGELSAVVADDHTGAASGFDDAIELSQDPQAGERGIHHESQAFPGEVIDEREDTEATAAHHRIHDGVERPAKVLVLRDRHRRPCAQSAFAAAALTHRQPLFLVKTIELFVIELDALTLKHQPQSPIAEPPTL